MQGPARFAWRGNIACTTSRCRIATPAKAPAPQKLGALLDGFCPEPRGEEQLAVNCNGRLLLLRVAEVDWLEAAGDQVAVHLGQETHLLNDSLVAVAAKLPADRFVRIGPSALLNVGQLNG
jgi:two-component system, LytTR family, response regulator